MSSWEKAEGLRVRGGIDGGVWSRVLSSTAPLEKQDLQLYRDRKGSRAAFSILALRETEGTLLGWTQTNLHWLQVSLPLTVLSAFARLPSAVGSWCFLLHSSLCGQLNFLCLFFPYWDTIHIT